MIGILELSFDPVLWVGSTAVRWDALGLVVTLALAIGVWILRLHAALGAELRFEDVSFVLLGAIPGAVVVGRLVHVLDFAGSYLVQPVTMLDLAHGSASLVGAVIGGALSAAYICRLLGGRVGVWADAASVPMLLAIGLGKFAVVLGGGGQGATTDGPLGVGFAGRGPWRSVDAGVAAWPSQALEGGWALLGIPVVSLAEVVIRRAGRRGRGIALLVALTWWLAGRACVAVTWRDTPAVGPLGPEALATLMALGVMIVGIALAWRTPDSHGAHQTVPEGPV